MKRSIYILQAFLMLFSAVLYAQPGKRTAFSKQKKATAIPDSLLYAVDSTKIDSVKTKAFRLTDKTGDRYRVPLDTTYLNFSNRATIDGIGLSTNYLANIGAPAQSRIFSERNDYENDFIFNNGYNYLITTSANALFYDVKDPRTHITYLRAGGQPNSEQQLNGTLTTNFGKKINIGADFDYTYVRGSYTSNANKNLYYRLFGNYLTDRYELHAHVLNFNYLNTENGGITNDRYVTHPDDFTDGRRKLDRQSFPSRFSNMWNRNKGKQLFFTHRYNLGFYREMTDKERKEKERKKEARRQLEERLKQEEEQENRDNNTANDNQQNNAAPQNPFEQPETDKNNDEDEIDAVFVPVSSIIHSFSYEGFSRRFLSDNLQHTQTIDADSIYKNHIYAPSDSVLDERMSSWNLKNTVGLSLREGFQDWAKFGLTAYAHFEKRRFTLPGESVLGETNYDEFSTYLGAELSKRQGTLLTYDARGEFCLAGSDLGEFRLEGNARTKFRIFGKDASIAALGSIKNVTPAFFMRHHHSRYFWWDDDLKKMQRVYAGGEIGIKQTKTTLSAGVESIQNYSYFGFEGKPEVFGSNLQVISARIRQDLRYQAFGWENEVCYQLSSEKNVLALPDICAYTNIYLNFTYAKVLKIQIGIDAHYFTSYYAPYYEPATQQFQNQQEKKVGNYPIINAYVNCFLKQTRFFINGYNLGSEFINPTEYFSAPHYPLNPMMIKMGLTVYFNN